MKRRAAMASVAGWLALVTVIPRPEAEACSCKPMYGPEGAGHFLTAAPTVPANAAGVLWWQGWPFAVAHDDEWTPPASRFRVERLGAGGAAAEVAFRLSSVEGDLFLIAPRGGMEPGGRYRFSARSGAAGRCPLSAEVAVDRRPLTASGVAAELVLGPPTLGSLEVSAAGSCSAVIAAASRSLEMRLPEAVARWAGALLFRTVVDGRTEWAPRRTICRPPLRGTSWTGRGTDLLFAACGERPAAFPGLAAGRHTVRMEAKLPGTDIVLQTPDVAFEIGCGPAGPARPPASAPAPASPPAAAPPAAPPPGCMEPLAGARRFCDGRVYPAGGRGHIHWTAYASKRSMGAALKHYLKACGRGGYEGGGGEHSFSFPLDRPTAVLSLSPPTVRGPWHECRLPRHTRAVISITFFPR